MSLKVTHKYSTAAGTPPASGDIDVGEIAINAADAELYTKDNAGNIRKFQNTTTGTADGVQFTQAGTGAVQRAVESKLQDVVSVKDFGAAGDGVTDDTAAIQAAIDNAKPVFFPPGTYIVRLSTAITLEGGATVCALKARTGMQLLGSGWGQTIIKLKDNESTDASPKYFNIIASNEVLDGVVIDGIKFNINGQNNKISPNRGANTYNRFNCAAFIVSGSVATVGVAARISNSRFSNCWIENSPGVTCIGLAQSSTVGNAIGKNVAIFNNVFYNNGIDTDDHSSVYMWGENINVFNNVFDAAAPSNGTQGPRVAAELHGDDNVFSNNIIQNYFQGIWVDGNLTTVSSNQIISNNTFTVSAVGIGLFSETAEVNNAKKNLIISDNIITITNDYPLTAAYKYGLSLKPSIGNFDGVFVSGNTIRSSDTHGSIGIDISTITDTIKDITINSNTVIGFSAGIVTTLAAGGTQDNVDISNNNILRVSPSTLTPTFTQGIAISGNHTNLRVSNNQIQGTVYFGLLLDASAVCQNLNVEGNNFVRTGLTVDIVDNITVSGTRSGRQALTFSALPTQSTWLLGDVVYTKNTTELGTAGSKYLITGWTRITNGTGNVLNTDWLENRVLTGN